jgi:CheY-like chemotaxis protein
MNKILLYAEDDAAATLALRQALLGADVSFNLHVIREGAAAIAYLSGKGIYADRNAFPLPDVMISNLNSKAKNPYEVLEWVRRQKQFRNLSFIFHSSSLTSSDLREATELGANSCFEKTTNCRKVLDYLRGKLADFAVRSACAQRDRAIRANA